MGLDYRDLDAETRSLMVEEIDIDVANGSLYLSNYLNEAGRSNWPTLLREASQHGSDDRLAAALRERGSFKQLV